MPSDARSSLLPAARRFVVLSGVAIVVTAGCAALVGLALGGAAARSAATGLYLVGWYSGVGWDSKDTPKGQAHGPSCKMPKLS